MTRREESIHLLAHSLEAIDKNRALDVQMANPGLEVSTLRGRDYTGIATMIYEAELDKLVMERCNAVIDKQWKPKTGEANNPTDTSYTPPAAGDAISLIATERRRQIEGEGWTPEHDAEHDDGALALAAAAYAVAAEARQHDGFAGPPLCWPWDTDWWKPSPDNRIRELVKAGALIVAEIERLQRAQKGPKP